MKNTKLALTLIAATLLGGSFAAQADSDNNGQENVERTQSFQAFVQHQDNGSGEVQADSSVFQNHDSNS